MTAAHGRADLCAECPGRSVAKLNGTRKWLALGASAVLLPFLGWGGLMIVNHEGRITKVEANVSTEVKRLDEHRKAMEDEVAAMATDIRGLRTYFLGPKR